MCGSVKNICQQHYKIRVVDLVIRTYNFDTGVPILFEKITNK